MAEKTITFKNIPDRFTKKETGEVIDNKKATYSDKVRAFGHCLYEDDWRLDARKLLQAAFSNKVDGEFIEIRMFKSKSDEKDTKRGFFMDIDAAVKFVRKNSDSLNVLFGLATRASNKSGKADNLKAFYILGFDYDLKHDAELSVEKLKSIYAELGIDIVYIISTGHGYHVYVLLERETSTERIRNINQAIIEITGADIQCSSPANTLRLPGTWNFKYENDIREVRIVCDNRNAKRYTLASLEEKIIEYRKEHKDNVQEKNKNGYSDGFCMCCIANMWEGVKVGHRNFAIGRLVKYLQQSGFKKEEAYKKIVKWNKRNKPPEGENTLKTKFESYWKGNYKLLGCRFDNPSLDGILSCYCNKENCNRGYAVGRLRLGNTVQFNNIIFSEYYEFTGNDILTLCVIMMQKEGLDAYHLRKELEDKHTGIACISDTALFNAKKSEKNKLGCVYRLRDMGLIDIVKGNRRNRESNFFIAKEYEKGFHEYTLVTFSAITGAIEGVVSSALFKLYVLLLKYAFKKGSCYPSMETLANEMGTQKGHISEYLKQLEAKGYIKIEYKVMNRKRKAIFQLLV